MPTDENVDFEMGCKLSPEAWARLNRDGARPDSQLRNFVAAFPPEYLMQNVSGLVSESDFASHGADFWLALSKLSPKPLSSYDSLLDFGCGCGRLGRMFKGHPGAVHGCDIDHRHVDWVHENLPFYVTQLTKPDAPLPYEDDKFDLIVSISIFTHLTEYSQDLLLAELHRISSKNGLLMLTIHGERATERAISEPQIWDMISVDQGLFKQAKAKFDKGEHAFILQGGHLTNADFEYGITFIPRSYISSRWGKWFHLENHASGAIHDFQDVIVLRPK